MKPSSKQRPRRTLPDGQKDANCGQPGRQRSGAQLMNSAPLRDSCATASGPSRTHAMMVDCRFPLNSRDAS